MAEGWKIAGPAAVDLRRRWIMLRAAWILGLCAVVGACQGDAVQAPAAEDMPVSADAAVAAEPADANVHRFQVESLEGEPVDLASYEGKVLLIVNTASV